MKKAILILVVLVLSLKVEAGFETFLKLPAKYAAKKIGIKTGKKVLSETTEAAIKISCRETSEVAIKFAGKYGDDAVKIFRKYGDDAVKATIKYGDEGIKIFAKEGRVASSIFKKYGDDGIGVFIKHSKELKPLIAKYGDDVVKPYIEHPGLGGKLVEIFGRDAAKISGRMTDDAAITIIKNSNKFSKKSLVRRILLNKNGKLSKVKIAAIIGVGTVGTIGSYTIVDKLHTFATNPLSLKDWIILSVFLIIVSIIIVIKIKYLKSSKKE
jgi:hypothetical protein